MKSRRSIPWAAAAGAVCTAAILVWLPDLGAPVWLARVVTFDKTSAVDYYGGAKVDYRVESTDPAVIRDTSKVLVRRAHRFGIAANACAGGGTNQPVYSKRKFIFRKCGCFMFELLRR